MRRQAADALTAQGLDEIVGWSFEGPELAHRLRIADRPAVQLTNPMSAEQSRLRTTLLGSLLDVAERNRARGAAALRLFEAGAVYLPADADAPATQEPHHVGVLLSGPVRPPTWREADPPAADFFAVKGVLHGMLDTLRVPWSLEATETRAVPAPRPSSAVLLDGDPRRVGGRGPSHGRRSMGSRRAGRRVRARPRRGGRSWRRSPQYQDVTSFPEVREDLAVIVADSVSAAEVLAVARRAGGKLLAGAEVFDVYRDAERIGAGNVSLALRLRFRAPDRTLTDEEVAARRRKIAEALATELQGRVRDS